MGEEGTKLEIILTELKEKIAAEEKKRQRIRELETLKQRGTPRQREDAQKALLRLLRGEEK